MAILSGSAIDVNNFAAVIASVAGIVDPDEQL